MPAQGNDPAHHEKTHHLDHINKALSNALDNWDPADGENVQIKIYATISPNPGGINDYRIVLDPA